MMRDNVAADGTLSQDRFLRALMLHRNTPDRDTGLSPAQVIFGKAIRVFFPIREGCLKLHPEWRITMEQREVALAQRHAKRGRDLVEHTKVLKPLSTGQVVMIQNQTGNHPNRWDKSGTVLEVLGFDKYKIKLDGTGRITIRNRRFLKPIVPYTKLSQSDGMDTGIPGGVVADQDGRERQVEMDETASGQAVQTRSGRLSRMPDRFGVDSRIGSMSSRWEDVVGSKLRRTELQLGPRCF